MSKSIMNCKINRTIKYRKKITWSLLIYYIQDKIIYGDIFDGSMASHAFTRYLFI